MKVGRESSSVGVEKERDASLVSGTWYALVNGEQNVWYGGSRASQVRLNSGLTTNCSVLHTNPLMSQTLRTQVSVTGKTLLYKYQKPHTH